MSQLAKAEGTTYRDELLTKGAHKKDHIVVLWGGGGCFIIFGKADGTTYRDELLTKGARQI